MRPVPTKGVLDIEAYVPGKSKAPAGVTLHKLSSNETPLGPPPAAREAAAAARCAVLVAWQGGTSARALETEPSARHGTLARCAPLALAGRAGATPNILAEGAIALSVTLSGGALFAS